MTFFSNSNEFWAESITVQNHYFSSGIWSGGMAVWNQWIALRILLEPEQKTLREAADHHLDFFSVAGVCLQTWIVTADPPFGRISFLFNSARGCWPLLGLLLCCWCLSLNLNCDYWSALRADFFFKNIARTCWPLLGLLSWCCGLCSNLNCDCCSALRADFF